MRKCLIVDESSVVRKVAARIVFQLGFEVEAHANLADAQASVAANGLPPLVIVSATSAAAEEAASFLRFCRARPEGRQPAILALLVEANLGLMTRVKRAGASGFLFKPFTRAEMEKGLAPFIVAPAADAVAA